MKTKLFNVLVCLMMGMSIPSLLAADKAAPKEISVVIARGVGLNADKALLNALGNAVQQVVGVIIDAETLIKNEKVVKDQILDFSNGFVEKFEKLKEGKNEDGLYEVTIRATVKHRQLIEKLKQAKVHSVKVDGQSLFGATASKMEAAGKGAALLKKGLEDLGLPMSLVTARVINQKPKVIAENDDAIQAEWIIRIGYDQKKYFEKVVPRLKQLLGEVATAKIQEPLVKQEKCFYYSDEKIAAIHSFRSPYQDWDGWQNISWNGIKHQTHKGTPVYLMNGWIPGSGRWEFKCYFLDQKSAKVLGAYYRGHLHQFGGGISHEVHLELKNAFGKTIFEEQFRLGIWNHTTSELRRKPLLLWVPQPGGNRGLKSNVARLSLFHEGESPYVDDDSFVGPNGRSDSSIPRTVVIMPLVYMYGPFKHCYLSDGALFRWKPQIPLNIMKNVTQVTCRVVGK